jgi:hypothetical protein
VVTLYEILANRGSLDSSLISLDMEEATKDTPPADNDVKDLVSHAVSAVSFDDYEPFKGNPQDIIENCPDVIEIEGGALDGRATGSIPSCRTSAKPTESIQPKNGSESPPYWPS